jgi:hypothetical protein
MKKIATALLTLAIGLPLLAADGFSSLEEQMSGKEFTGAGLDKLTPQELATLNEWIRRHSLGTLDAPKAVATTTPSPSATTTTSEPVDKRGLKSEESEDRTPITSRLVGSFSGWDGQTIFKLENGMIWAQSDKDKFYTKELQNPVVTIKPGMFGTWRLQVEDFGSKCRVKRIQ